jgi:endo-alpha-1,4-polygalactosaminidase (GH114 family)
MTMRELDSSLRNIRKRVAAANSFQAALRGIRLNLPNIDAGPAEETHFSDDEEALFDKRIREAQARKQAEMRGHGG